MNGSPSPASSTDTRLRKRLKILAVAGIILVALTGAVLYEGAQRASTVEAALHRVRTTVSEQVMAEAGAIRSKQTSKTIASLAKIRAHLPTAPECQQLSAWWQIAPQYAQIRQKCAERQHVITIYSRSLDETLKLLQYDSSLNALLKKTTIYDNTKPLSTGAAAWTEASDALKRTPAPTIAQSFAQQLQTAINEVIAGWQSLVASDNSQNKVDYDAAMKEMLAAYDTVQKQSRSFSQILDRQRDTLVAAFETAIH